MVATPLRDKNISDGDCIFTIGDESKLSLTKTAAVFGANASEKSNFVKALAFYKWYIPNSAKEIQAGEPVPVDSFALSSVSASEPTMVEAVIWIEGSSYRYGFEVVKSGVSSEWLYIRSGKKRSKEIESKELTSKNMLRDNALLLSLAGQFNDPVAVSIMKWLVDTTIITAGSEKEIRETAVKRLDDVETRRKIVDFSRYADLGIEVLPRAELVSFLPTHDMTCFAHSHASNPHLWIESRCRGFLTAAFLQ